MKRILILSLLVATVASADWRLTSQGFLPNQEPWISQGWPLYTDAGRSNYGCAASGGTISNGVCVVPPPVPPDPNSAIQYVSAPTVVLSNGVYFVDEDGHVQKMTASNGVVFVTQVSDSPLNLTLAQARTASNAVVQVSIQQETRTNALYAAAMLWAAGNQNTLANALATYKPTTTAGTNLVRVQWMLLRMQGRKEAGQ